jgi:hypothetical protein
MFCEDASMDEGRVYGVVATVIGNALAVGPRNRYSSPPFHGDLRYLSNLP